MQPDNLWQASAGARLQSTPLDQDIAVDVAIIGAGFTGCAAALEAAQSGASVAVLEAQTVGHGGAGRNVGLVNAGLWLPPDEVCQQLGQSVGEKLNQALAQGPEQVFTTIAKYHIDCEAVRAGTLHCAHSAGGVRDLQNRLQQQQARKAPVELLDASTAQRLTGSPLFHGALLDRRAGTVQPLSYVLGLAEAAQRMGTQFYQQTPAVRITQEKGEWLVQSPRGCVRAQALLVATNAYHEGLQMTKPPQYTAVHYCQAATAPLDDRIWQSLLPEQQGCWDTALIMSSFRRDAAGRLVIGGMGSLESFGAPVHRRWLKRKLRQLFPQLGDQPFEYMWQGRIAMTGDHIPKLIRLGEKALSVHGYSGRGISPGTVFGQSVARWIDSGDEADLPLPLDEEYSEALTGIKQHYYEAGATLIHAVN